jgi:hypothetical protein
VTATRPAAIATCLCAAAAFIICAALLALAALMPPPPYIVPLVVITGLGVPLAAAWDLPAAVRTLRAEGEPLRRLRADLAQLPEVQHPLGW